MDTADSSAVLEAGRPAAELEVSGFEASVCHAVFDTMREPVLVVDHQQRVTFWNPAAAEFFDDELAGRDIQELLPCLSLPLDGLDDPDGVWQGRIWQAGKSRDLEVSRSLAADPGSPFRAVYVVHDMSRHTLLTQRKDELLYDLAHEIRGPISTLENALDMLAVGDGSMSTIDHDRLLGSARRTAGRLHEVLENLLTAGAIASGQFAVHPRPVAVQAILDDAVDMVRPLTETRGQRVDVQLPDDCSDVLADPTAIRQVLYNLLSNASRHSPKESCLTLRVLARATDLLVAVEDEGAGIPPEQRVHLFERFFRGQRHRPGIGLGLGIVRGIVDAHGGQVGFQPAPQRGTIFWFTLPLAASEPAVK